MALIPVESSENKESDVARVGHHCGTRVRQAALHLSPKARSIRQRCNFFARDLQRAAGGTYLRCPLSKRSAWHERPRSGACLRAAFAHFREKANAVSGLGLSAGATRHQCKRCPGPTLTAAGQAATAQALIAADAADAIARQQRKAYMSKLELQIAELEAERDVGENVAV